MRVPRKGITTFMNAAINAKGIKLDSSLVNHIPIADPSFRHKFLAVIQRAL